MKNFHEGTIGIPQGDGRYKVAYYEVECCSEPDPHCIDEGRICCLVIKIAGEVVAEYDCGWIVEPDLEDQSVQVAYLILLESYN